MAPDDDSTLEGQEQVLPARFDPLEALAIDPLRDAEQRRAGVGSLGRHDLTLEHAQPLSDPVQAVTLGHPLRLAEGEHRPMAEALHAWGRRGSRRRGGAA
jgi:hypothetical protein